MKFNIKFKTILKIIILTKFFLSSFTVLLLLRTSNVVGLTDAPSNRIMSLGKTNVAILLVVFMSAIQLSYQQYPLMSTLVRRWVFFLYWLHTLEDHYNKSLTQYIIQKVNLFLLLTVYNRLFLGSFYRMSFFFITYWVHSLRGELISMF